LPPAELDAKIFAPRAPAMSRGLMDRKQIQIFPASAAPQQAGNGDEHPCLRSESIRKPKIIF